MATSSGNSGSETHVGLMDDQRKRKRMLSNRESARRSRMRKQKHLDDLMSQVSQMQRENTQISNSINVTTQHFLNVEAENSVLRAQMMELSHRLQSLDEILSYMNGQDHVEEEEYQNYLGFGAGGDQGFLLGYNNSYNNNLMGINYNQQNHYPIMASAAASEMFDY